MRKETGLLGRRSGGIASLVLLCLLAACATHSTRHAYRGHYAPSHYYPPPGPPSDPWGPYVREAAHRFGVPEQWIREVMRQESGGDEQAISSSGAMGLMQLMPGTYDDLQQRYGLGADPFEPHDNVMAGTAYLRAMYDRFGAPGFLAAYNAGPGRVDDYLSGGSSLPDETVNYVAAIAPRLGNTAQFSGPLAVYAGGGDTGYAAPPRRRAARSGACDPDAAYDPSYPCSPVVRQANAAPVPVAAPLGAPVLVASSQPAGACDPDAAYDPGRPCAPAPQQQAAAPTVVAEVPVAASQPAGPCDPDAAYDPSRTCAPAPQQVAAVVPVVAVPLPDGGCDADLAHTPGRGCAPAVTRAVLRAPASGGQWSIQVGAFASPATARAAAESVRAGVADLLAGSRVDLPPTTPFGGNVLYRARLAGLPADTAADACVRLRRAQVACIVVPPGQAQ
jgi:hypothetical protein